ncbi:MAG TPA: hypothetical protein ENL09_02450 [Bacteroidetes bacterium]|nr:hypothetical protein [Bacteroidota bacterium]
MKTPRPVKTKIARLSQHFGGRQKLADKLGVTTRYIYYMENGRIPGRHLYHYICELYQSIK